MESSPQMEKIKNYPRDISSVEISNINLNGEWYTLTFNLSAREAFNVRLLDGFHFLYRGSFLPKKKKYQPHPFHPLPPLSPQYGN